MTKTMREYERVTNLCEGSRIMTLPEMLEIIRDARNEMATPSCDRSRLGQLVVNLNQVFKLMYWLGAHHSPRVTVRLTAQSHPHSRRIDNVPKRKRKNLEDGGLYITKCYNAKNPTRDKPFL